MWLITTQGFYSVVAHRHDPELLLVRARTREDIEALREQIPSLEPFENRSADYRHRAEVTREQWREAVTQLAGAIDYGNFKSAVGKRQGWDRERVYHAVWDVLARLQQ